MTQRCLIAGCGDVGTRLGLLLAARGIATFGLRRAPGVLPDAIAPVHADLTEPDSLRALPPAIDTLVFAAAAGARDEASYRRVYLEGLQNIVAALRRQGGLRRVVFVSSSSTWGDCGGRWVDETTPCLPDDFNGRILLEAERWLGSQPEPSTALRLAGIYGPGREALLRRVQLGGPCTATPVNWSNRIHVDDAAAALAHVLVLADAAPPLLIGCDDRPAPLYEVLSWLAARLGVPPPQPLHEGEGPERNKRLSNRLLRDTGFLPLHRSYVEGYGAVLADRRAHAQ